MTTCSQFLGWLGADVIKIEPPGSEQSRRNRPGVGTCPRDVRVCVEYEPGPER